MERIVLIGGPCSGQIHDVENATLEVTARDDAGDQSAYVRTNAVNLDGDVQVVLFRLSAPEHAEQRLSA